MKTNLLSTLGPSCVVYEVGWLPLFTSDTGTIV